MQAAGRTSVTKIAEMKKMKQAAVMTAMRAKNRETRKKTSSGMYLLIRYSIPNGGGSMLEMDRPWDVDEIKAIVGEVTDPAKYAVKFEEEVKTIISMYNPSTREIEEILCC